LKTLAEVVVYLMETLTTADEGGIDWHQCGDITNYAWLDLAKTSSAEREALADVARKRLAVLLAEPDEYGYTPRAAVTPDQREFLESLADGSAWQEFDYPEADFPDMYQ
jgi:hypothetical protein